MSPSKTNISIMRRGSLLWYEGPELWFVSIANLLFKMIDFEGYINSESEP